MALSEQRADFSVGFGGAVLRVQLQTPLLAFCGQYVVEKQPIQNEKGSCLLLVRMLLILNNNIIHLI